MKDAKNRIFFYLKTLIILVFASSNLMGQTKSYIHKVLNSDNYTTTKGQGIPIWTFSSSQNPSIQLVSERFLIQGGLHGNELLTSVFVEWLYQGVSDNKSLLNQIPDNIIIDFIPYANPDSYGVSRYNANFVNLNRNFGTFWGKSLEPNGHSPFSEKETKAIKSLMKRKKYLSAVDIHGYQNWIVAPSLENTGYDSVFSAEMKNRYHLWYQALNTNRSLWLPEYKLLSAMSLGDGGAFEDWSFWENNTLAFCLEMKTQERFSYSGNKILDSFTRYERFIYEMFKNAISINQRSSLAFVDKNSLGTKKKFKENKDLRNGS